MKRHILLVGGGGRESAFARALARDSVVSAVLSHANPSIVRCASKSGGRCYQGDVCSPEFVQESARNAKADYVFVNADNPLAAGVVDALLEAGIKAIGPTRAGARIEWDKVYATRLMERLFPEHTPHSRVADSAESCADAVAAFAQRDLAVVVKPQGLTGGKGVKVMGEHLRNYEEALDYARSLLVAGGEQVLLCEKMSGREFTVMGVTDGRDTVFAPATYDYPYRYEGDTGAGTGGMGCLTDIHPQLPFMSTEDYALCQRMMSGVIDDLRKSDIHFNGVLNGGFFITDAGVRFMEFNSRFGDPEAINVLAVLRSSFAELLETLYEQRLAQRPPVFHKKASVVKYLVSPEYPKKLSDSKTPPLEFDMPVDAIEARGVAVDCASMVETHTPNRYQALPGSRVVAFSSIGDSVPEVANIINDVIDECVDGGLEYRRDIGSQQEMDKLHAALPKC